MEETYIYNMNKNYIQPQISVIHVDNADIICTSAPKNGRGKKAYPPYDRLTDEQQLAFYFLLEYFASYATDSEWNYIKHDAVTYLEKATWYLGLTKKQAVFYRPHYQDINKIINILKGISNNKEAFDYMVNNSYNLILLAEGEKRKEIGKFYIERWQNEFGYTYEEIKIIQRKYMYRTDI